MKKNLTKRAIVFRAVVGMVVTAAIAYLFNFAPDKVGIYRTILDRTTFTPLLAPAFSEHISALNLWWGLSFTFYGILLWTKNWTPALRWTEVALDLMGAYVLAGIAIADPFLPAAGGGLVRYLLAFAVIGMIIASARKLKKLVDGRWLIYGPDPARD